MAIICPFLKKNGTYRLLLINGGHFYFSAQIYIEYREKYYFFLQKMKLWGILKFNLSHFTICCEKNMYKAFLTKLVNFKFPVFAKYGQNTPKMTPKIEKKNLQKMWLWGILKFNLAHFTICFEKHINKSFLKFLATLNFQILKNRG